MSKEFCVAYMRYSTNNQTEVSIEYQTRAIEAYCASKGLTLCDTYIDRAKSGTNDNREAFLQMIADAQRKPVWTKLLVHDYSRFSRNVENATHYAALLHRCGVYLVSVTEPSGNTPEDRLNRNIKFAIDQYYAEHYAEITFESLLAVAKKAKTCGGPPPLGYRFNKDGKLEIEPDSAALVKKIFEMYLAGTSLRNMAKILNEEGYKTGANKPFTKTSFYNLLKQEKYTGLYVWNKRTAGVETGQSSPKYNNHSYKPIEDQVRIEGGCPEIISPEDFQKVQEMLAKRSRGQSPTKSRRHYFLSGLGVLKCAVCGRALEGKPRTCRGRSYNAYVCPNHIGKNALCPTKELDATYIDELVVKAVLTMAFRKEWLSGVNKELKQFSYDDILRRKLMGVEKKIANLAKGIEMQPSQTLVDNLAVAEQEKKELQIKLWETKGKAFKVTEENYKEVYSDLKEFLLTSPTLEARKFLRSIIKEIKVSNDTINLTMEVA